jgi:hypothetical protein
MNSLADRRRSSANARVLPSWANATGRYQRQDDGRVLRQIRAVTNSRATCGYRRVWATVNRTSRTDYNQKWIRRVMRLHARCSPPRPPAPRPPIPGPDPAAGLEPARGLGCLLDPLLERRGDLRGLRRRLPRSRGLRQRRVPAAADGGGSPNADGPDAVGAVRRGCPQSAARDQWLSDNGPQVLQRKV